MSLCSRICTGSSWRYPSVTGNLVEIIEDKRFQGENLDDFPDQCRVSKGSGWVRPVSLIAKFHKFFENIRLCLNVEEGPLFEQNLIE